LVLEILLFARNTDIYAQPPILHRQREYKWCGFDGNSCFFAGCWFSWGKI